MLCYLCFLTFAKASHLIQTQYYIMRPFQNSKALISFDNAQCRCFQTPQPNQQFFLTKNQIPSNLNAQKNKKEIPENIKQALAKTSIKRSLKRMGSPHKNETVETQRSAEIEKNLSFNDSRHSQNNKVPILSNYKSPVNAYEIKKSSVNATTISFNRPYYDYNTPIKINSPTYQQQSLQQSVNPEKNNFTTNQYVNPFKKIETSKINFNFIPTATKVQASPNLKDQISNCKSLKNIHQTPVTFMNEKKIPQSEKVQIKKLNEQIKIPKLQRKNSKFQSTDLGITQTITKNSILYSGTNASPEKTQVYDKIEMRETAIGLKDCSDLDFKNQNIKITQTTKLKQNTYKSVINPKRSLLSETNRSKIVAKKEKIKPMLIKCKTLKKSGHQRIPMKKMIPINNRWSWVD